MIARAAVAFWLALAVASVAAQRPAGPPPGRAPVPPVQLSASVSVVLVDAVVLDGQGRFVTDLRREDVVVLEDGRPQTMAGFELVSLATAAPAPSPLASVPVAPVDTRSNARPFDGRIYFIVVDDLHISAPRTNLARSIARQFIEQQVGADDLAAVITTSGNRNAAQGFTSDKSRLLRAVDACVGRKVISPALAALAQSGTPEEGQRGTADPQRVYNARSAFETLSRIAAFAGTVRQRRKALVLVGEGVDYDLEGQDASAQELRGDMRAFVGAANRANLTIYPFDPRVYTHLGDDFVDIASTPPGDMEAGAEKIKSTMIQDDAVFAQDNLRTLAAETGGFASVASPGFTKAFDQIHDEQSQYYLIGYYPSNEARDGKFRSIELRVSRPGVSVKARRGYTPGGATAAPAEAPPPAAAEAAAGVSPELRRALESALPVPGLTLRGMAAPFKGTADKASVAIIVQASGRDLLFTPKDGRFEDTVELAAVALDGFGRPQGGTRATVSMPLSERSAAAVERMGVVFQMRLDLAPGSYQLRIAARDGGSGVAGAVHYELDVPDYAKLPLALSGIVLSAEYAGQVPSPRPDPELDRWLPATPVTQRQFGADDTLTAMAAVYATGPEAGGPVEVTTTVLDDGGRAAYQRVDRYPAGNGNGGGPRDARVHRATIPLAGLRPGTYRLRVEAVRPGGRGAPTAVRDLAFAVR